ncbi:hypothetical protein K2O51_26625 [Cupriavidus pinatubonensis]|uniref:hypothetical protein n=1 Tax=Cupriavidus pinatubonensis TaxID=248026 RepID=UPI001C734D8B|nr:hypothetical protein [Cupriavidus pinatubonensis]QYY30885.1 hypothetical protein K2O51_26625 [Cupriavidus pinatubonensis]
MDLVGNQTMPKSNKKRPPAKLSPFAQARAQADFLLGIASSKEVSSLKIVRIGRRKKRLDEVKAELNAARARVEAQFAQRNTETDAIRQRISSAPRQDVELPFNVMAGERR